MSAPIGYNAPTLVPAAGAPADNADILALIEEEQKRQEEERQRLQQQAQGQQQAATGLRRLGLVTGMGTNPLLQGFSAKALGQAGAMDANAARLEARVPQSDRFGQQVALARIRAALRPPPGGAASAFSTDPASDASKKWQAIIQQNAPGKYPPEVLARMSEADIRGAQGALRASLQSYGTDVTKTLGEKRIGLGYTEEGGRNARFGEKLAADEAERQAARTERTENKIADSTKDLVEAVDKTGAPGFLQRYNEAQAIISRYGNDLPGLGRFDGYRFSEAQTEDGRKLQMLIGQMLSDYRKGQTGAGMSDAERVEYGHITGLLQRGNDDDIRMGMGILKRALDARLVALSAGARPEAVERVAQRAPAIGSALRRVGKPATTPPKRMPMPSGELGEQPPSPTASSQIPATPGADTVLMIAPDGTRRRVPRSRVDAAIKAGGRLADG